MVSACCRDPGRGAFRFLGLIPWAVFLVVVAGVLLSISGCGYTLGYRRPEGVYSVAVPIFDNRTFPLRREVEYELTSAVRRELQARTPLTLASSEDADLVVFGAVLSFHEFVIAEGRADEKLESTILITVTIRVENYREGTVREETVESSEPLSIARGETIAEARRRAVDNLAEKIVLRIEDW